jgi:ABC-type polysaccharide/polyol phosphate export permease
MTSPPSTKTRRERLSIAAISVAVAVVSFAVIFGGILLIRRFEQGSTPYLILLVVMFFAAFGLLMGAFNAFVEVVQAIVARDSVPGPK